MSPALEIFSIIQNPGYVERSWRCNDLAQLEFLVMVADGMGERGSNSFFAQKFGKFIYLNQENSTETCFLDFACLSDSQPSINRGIWA